MTVELGVAVTGERAERVVSDLLVAPFFAGERPLRGVAGRVDWRLCGLLSEQMLAGTIAGEADEAVLVLSGGRLKSPRVLLYGLPPRTGFGASDLAGCARGALGRAAALRAGRVALALPSEARSGIAPDRAAVAVLSGAGEALAPHPHPLHLTLVVEAEAAPVASAAIADLARRRLASGVAVRVVGAPRPRSDRAGRPERSPEGDARGIEAPHRRPPSLR